jgi:CDP-glucose 4,6-dehydratase
VLITGASGFVGSRLVSMLLDRGASIIAFIRDHDPASPLWLSGDIDRVSVVSGRLENYDEVRATIVEREPDTIFHLGAQAIVAAGSRDPRGTFESNIRGTYNLLEACRLHGVPDAGSGLPRAELPGAALTLPSPGGRGFNPGAALPESGLPGVELPGVRRIIIASSDKAYGECDSLPCTEETPLAARPRNPYDLSKSCADLIAQSYAAAFPGTRPGAGPGVGPGAGLPIAIARCGNIFGPGDLHWSRLVPGTMRSLLYLNEPPRIRSDGTLVRDYLHVDDAARAYLALADWLDSPASAADHQRAFNFSSGRPLTVLEMVHRIACACGFRGRKRERELGREDLKPVIEDRAAGEIREQWLDSTRARTILGWRAEDSIDDALTRTAEWYRWYFQRGKQRPHVHTSPGQRGSGAGVAQVEPKVDLARPSPATGPTDARTPAHSRLEDEKECAAHTMPGIVPPGTDGDGGEQDRASRSVAPSAEWEG